MIFAVWGFKTLLDTLYFHLIAKKGVLLPSGAQNLKKSKKLKIFQKKAKMCIFLNSKIQIGITFFLLAQYRCFWFWWDFRYINLWLGSQKWSNTPYKRYKRFGAKNTKIDFCGVFWYFFAFKRLWYRTSACKKIFCSECKVLCLVIAPNKN